MAEEQNDYIDKRLRYFDRQLLTARDLQDEQEYHLDRQRRIGRALHISGIVEGLEIREGDDKATVTPGAALDGLGRQIVLTEERMVNLEETPRDLTVKLFILYHDEESDTMTTLEGVVGEVRFHEKPILHVIEPGTSPPNHSVFLADLIVNGEGSVTVNDDQRIYTGIPLLAGEAGRYDLDGDLSVTGAVGVGTMSPTERLEVAGNVKANEFIVNSADYAEYFESDRGVEIPVGVSVGVDKKGKIRPAKRGDAPIGVISKSPSVLGNSPAEWPGKYQRDEFGNVIMDEVRKEMLAPKKELEAGEGQTAMTMEGEGEDSVGDGIPEMAGTGEFTIDQAPRLNPDYNPSRPYVNRGKRPEWHCVGLLGQIPLRKGQPVAPTWVKIKEISENVELWLVK